MVLNLAWSGSSNINKNKTPSKIVLSEKYVETPFFDSTILVCTLFLLTFLLGKFYIAGKIGIQVRGK